MRYKLSLNNDGSYTLQLTPESEHERAVLDLVADKDSAGWGRERDDSYHYSSYPNKTTGLWIRFTEKPPAPVDQ